MATGAVPLTPQFVGSAPSQMACKKSVCGVLIPVLVGAVAVLLVVILIRVLHSKSGGKTPSSTDAQSVQYAARPYARNVPSFPAQQQQQQSPQPQGQGGAFQGRFGPYSADMNQMLNQRYQQIDSKPYADNKMPAYQNYAEAVGAQGQVQALNEEAFNKRILQQKEPALVAFVMQGCGHCDHLKPDFVEAAKHSKIALVVVERSGAGGLLQKYGIRGFPTILMFRGGDNVATYTGDRSVQSLVNFANQ